MDRLQRPGFAGKRVRRAGARARARRGGGLPASRGGGGGAGSSSCARPGRFLHGEYSARIKVPDAPGSLSAFFLYQDVRGDNDEIDIEIHNDGSRRALLTVWSEGRMVHEARVRLPFDPAADFHDYAVRWSAREVVFLADGAPLGSWSGRIPAAPMRLMIKAWWPTWLRCDPGARDGHLLVESVRLVPAASSGAR